MVGDDNLIAGDSPFDVIEPVWWSATFYDTFAEFEASLAPFSWPQRLVWAVIWHNTEVVNGGHGQFFSNSTGMLWPEAQEGLEAIGRADLASILRDAAERFSRPLAREREERDLQMEATILISTILTGGTTTPREIYGTICCPILEGNLMRFASTASSTNPRTRR